LSDDKTPSTLRIALAFLAIYVVWGSTYVAIKFSLESLPPFLMAAIRFTIAGILMSIWCKLQGAPAPKRENILPTFILGILLLVFGSTGVVLAEKSVPSGLVSLLVTTVPIYIVLLQWLRPGGTRPTLRVIAGLAMGLIGMLLLLDPRLVHDNESIDYVGVSYVLVGALGSAIGVLYAPKAKLPVSQQVAAAMEMLGAGVALFVIAFCCGEYSYFAAPHISLKSILSMVYLIVFGSMVAFSAYAWLLKVVSPSRVATYAYVNPVVALLLGWLLAGEPLTASSIIGSGVVLSAVWLITQANSGNKTAPANASIKSK
jgi:drug/metabolite transporter (DMT)-like permease